MHKRTREVIPALSELLGRKVECPECRSVDLYFSHDRKEQRFFCQCVKCGCSWRETRKGVRDVG